MRILKGRGPCQICEIGDFFDHRDPDAEGNNRPPLQQARLALGRNVLEYMRGPRTFSFRLPYYNRHDQQILKRDLKLRSGHREPNCPYRSDARCLILQARGRMYQTCVSLHRAAHGLMPYAVRLKPPAHNSACPPTPIRILSTQLFSRTVT